MVAALREHFNQTFTAERYRRFLEDLNSQYPGAIDFRVAETPVFIDKSFSRKLLNAGEAILDIITAGDFKYKTEKAIPETDRVPHENHKPHIIALDFAVCRNASGELEPQLIELQGFPSLMAFQVYYPERLRQHFEIPENYRHYLNGYDRLSFLKDFRELLLGGHDPSAVILLEIKPHEQKTRIDFYCTREYTGIEPLCITQLIREGRQLYYLHPTTGKKTRIERIYNRVIFDELQARRHELGPIINITDDLEVEWVPHPNWFYRISKYTLPLIRHPFVPPTYYVNELKQIPAHLNQYVLKPLFSFAGQGVVIDVKAEHLEQLADPENWILQRKVEYADLIPTPDVPAKVEIRLMYLWKEEWERPRPAINLARLSKGKMIGVRYNKDKEWVGGSVCFIEQ